MKTSDFGSKLPQEIRYFFPQLDIKLWEKSPKMPAAHLDFETPCFSKNVGDKFLLHK